MIQSIERIVAQEIDPAYAKRAAFIFQSVEEVRPKKILEVGCGRGFYLQALALYDFPKEIYGVDLNEKYLERAKEVCQDERIVLQQGSIYALPYKADTFDFVLLTEILEHLSDDVSALTEIRRVLKPGGTVVVTVPNMQFPFAWDPLNWVLMHVFHTHVSKDIWWLAGIWADHDHLYRKEVLVKKIKQAGFTIKEVRPVLHYCWPFSHFILYGIGKNIVERLGVRRFDRFAFQRKKSSWLARLFRYPSRFDNTRHSAYMNICLSAQK